MNESPIARGASPDAALLDLCAKFHAYRANIDAWNAGEIAPKEGEEANFAWNIVYREITDIPALTPEGLREKARALHHAIEMTQGEAADAAHEFALSLARDVFGGEING